jgi:hypothetical protein
MELWDSQDRGGNCGEGVVRVRHQCSLTRTGGGVILFGWFARTSNVDFPLRASDDTAMFHKNRMQLTCPVVSGSMKFTARHGLSVVSAAREHLQALVLLEWACRHFECHVRGGVQAH